jgi:DNA invertase Pin-like site-specific DNA recombinase
MDSQLENQQQETISPSKNLKKLKRTENYDSKGRNPYYSFLSTDFYVREVIRSTIKAKGLFVRRIAKRLGIDYSKLIRYLNKDINPNVRKVSDREVMWLAEYLGLDLSVTIKFKK